MDLFFCYPVNVGGFINNRKHDRRLPEQKKKAG